MKLAIDRRYWWHGQGPDDSRLLLPNGTRCCVGHLARACGVPDAITRDAGTIESLVAADENHLIPHPQLLWTLRGADSSALWPDTSPEGSTVYMANDDEYINDAEREVDLISRFALHDIALTFFDGTTERDETHWEDA